jgi:hypothetical protein
MSYQKQIDKADILRYESNIHSPTTLDSASLYITASRMISGSIEPIDKNDTWNFLRSWYYCSGSFPEWRGNMDGSSHASNRNSPYRYFMKGYDTGQYLTKFNKTASLISISQTKYGEEIKPGTFIFKQNVINNGVDTPNNGLLKIIDDSRGNLYSPNPVVSQSASQSLSSSLNYVGNIWYEQGIAVFTETGSWSGSVSYQDLADHSGTGASWEIGFESTHTLYSTEYNLKIEPHEFLYTSNPSSRAFISGSSAVSASIMMSPFLRSSVSSSINDFVHFTTVALYGDNKDHPIMLARYPQAIKSDPKVPIILKLRFDMIM